MSKRNFPSISIASISPDNPWAAWVCGRRCRRIPAGGRRGVILSAYDNFTNVKALASTPLWVFQGEADETVPVTLVRDMMKQLKKAHANLRYTEYPKTDHEVWKKAFAEPDLLPWLSSQKRGQAAGGQLGSGAGAATH